MIFIIKVNLSFSDSDNVGKGGLADYFGRWFSVFSEQSFFKNTENPFESPPRRQAVACSRPHKKNGQEYLAHFSKVGKGGLEPPLLSELVPKTSAYSNSATCA